MTYLVYCKRLRFCESAGGIECIWGELMILLLIDKWISTFFKEEPDLVATIEKVVVSYVLTALTGREFGHWVVVQRETV
jgi:hypothetical protein